MYYHSHSYIIYIIYNNNNIIYIIYNNIYKVIRMSRQARRRVFVAGTLAEFSELTNLRLELKNALFYISHSCEFDWRTKAISKQDYTRSRDCCHGTYPTYTEPAAYIVLLNPMLYTKLCSIIHWVIFFALINNHGIKDKTLLGSKNLGMHIEYAVPSNVS